MRTTEASPSRLYFGYGSNLWLDQMRRRCPESKFVGVASLSNWRWIISERGYANIVPSKDDVVYALLYELSQADEKSLDVYEGVPDSYEKKIVKVEYREKGIVTGTRISVSALVYVDEKRVKESQPRTEYVYRMNMGIADAIQEGIPKEYVDKYLRPFIPPSDGHRC